MEHKVTVESFFEIVKQLNLKYLSDYPHPHRFRSWDGSECQLPIRSRYSTPLQLTQGSLQW